MDTQAEKLYIYLKGFFSGGRMHESLKALGFAREVHKGQKRDSGEDYIIHPLRMASHATDFGVFDDDIMAAILLHDVIEDCQMLYSSLPVNDKVKEIVKYMTIEYRDDETALATKMRYFHNMSNSAEAIIVKGLDRIDNMSSMIGFAPQRIIKNVNENEKYVLPLLRDAAKKYPFYSHIYYGLRREIDIISKVYKCYLPDKKPD